MAQCLECGGDVVVKHKPKVFCSPACQKAVANRKLAEGSAVIVAAKAWAMTRHAKPGTREAQVCSAARSELTAILRELNAADAAAGRASAVDLFAAMMADGTRWMDRRRS